MGTMMGMPCFFAGCASGWVVSGTVASVVGTVVSVGAVVGSVVGAVVSATVRRKVASMVWLAFTFVKVYTPTEPMLLPSTFTSSTS